MMMTETAMAMKGTMATGQRRGWTARWQCNGDGGNGNGRCNGDSEGNVGIGQRDGDSDGMRDGNATATTVAAMEGAGDSNGNSGDGRRDSIGNGKHNIDATATAMYGGVAMVIVTATAREGMTAMAATAMDGAMAPPWQGTARRLLDGDGR